MGILKGDFEWRFIGILSGVFKCDILNGDFKWGSQMVILNGDCKW